LQPLFVLEHLIAESEHLLVRVGTMRLFNFCVDSIIYAAARVWHGRCDYTGQESAARIAGFPILKLGWSGVHMFDGKNNRLLDSFSFRLALTAAVFAVWSGAGYVLLYLA